MPLTSTQERPCEVHRERRVRRLCRADVVDDGRGLARHDRTAPGCEPFRLVALCLASGSVFFCRLYDRAFVDYDYHRAVSSPWTILKQKRRAARRQLNAT